MDLDTLADRAKPTLVVVHSPRVASAEPPKRAGRGEAPLERAPAGGAGRARGAVEAAPNAPAFQRSEKPSSSCSQLECSQHQRWEPLTAVASVAAATPALPQPIPWAPSLCRTVLHPSAGTLQLGQLPDLSCTHSSVPAGQCFPAAAMPAIRHKLPAVATLHSLVTSLHSSCSVRAVLPRGSDARDPRNYLMSGGARAMDKDREREKAAAAREKVKVSADRELHSHWQISEKLCASH